MSIRADTLVLGAGFVGLGAALALQARGRDVVVIDSARAPGLGASYGNSGLIERSSVVLQSFPRDFQQVFKTLTGRNAAARIDWRHILQIAPWLLRYVHQGAPERTARCAQAAVPLLEQSIAAHMRLAEPAGAKPLFRRGGWIKAYRSQKTLAQGLEQAEKILPYGLRYEALQADALSRLEPNVTGFAGAVRYIDALATVDPGALAAAYGRLFENRGGRIISGDARSLEETGHGWRVATPFGPCEGREAVLALGPWSDDVFRLLGYDIPLGVKRGYHMHYSTRENAMVGHPILDSDGGYLVAPMTRGLRLTTGAEFTIRDAPPNPVQLDRVEPLARISFPLGERLDDAPWMGSRPCLPDLLPVIGPAGRHHGLWFDFGHQHHGLTLGPASGELLAQMMTGEPPFADPTPFRADRF